MKRAVVVLSLLSACVLAGCSARSVRIADLKDQPGRYDDKAVRVTGTVTTAWGAGALGSIPLASLRIYNIDDGTGEITVVSQSGGQLRRGNKVEVRGTISELALIGGNSVGLHIREESRKVRN